MTPLPNSEGIVQISVNMDEEQPSHSSDIIDAPSMKSMRNERGNGVHRILGLDLFKESDRLKTFENWTVSFIDKRALAAAGFYYTDSSDIVKCPFCQIEVGRWVQGDDPMSDHRKHSQNCKFVLRQTADSDLPPDVQPDENPAVGEDSCGPYNFENTNSPTLNTEEENERCAVLDKLKINTSDLPLYPQYSTYEDRLKTFEHWPLSSRIPADALSLAGFVYTRSNDGTFCFHCGGSLRNWDDYDEPWIEHAHWFPKCKYILKMRGQKFIDDARVKKHEDLVQTQQAMRNAIETIKGMLPEVEDISAPKNFKESSSEGNSSNDESANGRLTDEPESEDNGVATCLICLDEKRNCVLLPCYHVVGCEKCVKKLKHCCVCREKIICCRRLYFS